MQQGALKQVKGVIRRFIRLAIGGPSNARIGHRQTAGPMPARVQAAHWRHAVIWALVPSVAGLMIFAAPDAGAANRVMASGLNSSGQLGNGEFGPLGCGPEKNTPCSPLPLEVIGMKEVSAISAGANFSLALKSGAVFAWGENRWGQLGNGTSEKNSDLSTEVQGLKEVSTIGTGGDTSYALKGGQVLAWGDNLNGQVGDGTTADRTEPVSVCAVKTKAPCALESEHLTGVIAIAGGSEHAIALLKDHTVVAWGLNRSGQLGNGTTANSDVPVKVEGLTKVTAIAATGGASYALLENGTVMSWGNGSLGQLGNGTNTNREVPVEVTHLQEVTAIAAIHGGGTGLALLKSGAVMAWGYNNWGQLGNGDSGVDHGEAANSNVPVRVCAVGDPGECPKGPFLNKVVALGAGAYRSLALLKNGNMLTWGDNEAGGLGDGLFGRTAYSDTPVEVQGLREVTAMASGTQHTLAIQSLPPQL